MGYRITYTMLFVVVMLGLGSYCRGSVEVSPQQSPEQRLIQDLLSSFGGESRTFARPISDPTRPITVKVWTYLVRIVDVDTSSFTLQANVHLRQVWKHGSLSWNASDYWNISSVTIPAGKLWQPDVVLWNSATSQQQHSSNAAPLVSSDGTVTLTTPLVVSVPCDVSVENYDLSDIKCSMVFVSLSDHSSKLQLEIMETKSGKIHPILKSPKWDVTETNVSITSWQACCPEHRHQSFNVDLTLRRGASFLTRGHVMMMLAQLSFMIPLMFLLSRDMWQRLLLGSALLVGHVVLILALVMYGTDLPTSAHSATHVITSTGMVFLSLVLNILLQKIYEEVSPKRKLPNVFGNIVFNCLARSLCVGTSTPYDQTHHADPVDPAMGKDEAHIDKMTIVQPSGVRQRRGEYQVLVEILDRLLFALFLIIAIVLQLTMPMTYSPVIRP